MMNDIYIHQWKTRQRPRREDVSKLPVDERAEDLEKKIVAINNATTGNLSHESVKQEEGGIDTTIKTAKY